MSKTLKESKYLVEFEPTSPKDAAHESWLYRSATTTALLSRHSILRLLLMVVFFSLKQKKKEGRGKKGGRGGKNDEEREKETHRSILFSVKERGVAGYRIRPGLCHIKIGAISFQYVLAVSYRHDSFSKLQ